jgi:hypothetical protein
MNRHYGFTILRNSAFGRQQIIATYSVEKWSKSNFGIIINKETKLRATWRKETAMETTTAALLLVVSSVLLACVVIDYAVGITEATLEETDIPQIARIRELEARILNQTDSVIEQTADLNSTAP